MSTLTVSAANQAAGTYGQNVAQAARALLAALFAIAPTRPQEQAASEAAPAARTRAREEVSLARLYRLAGSYDSVMPNLAQELRMIARD